MNKLTYSRTYRNKNLIKIRKYNKEWMWNKRHNIKIKPIKPTLPPNICSHCLIKIGKGRIYTKKFHYKKRTVCVDCYKRLMNKI